MKILTKNAMIKLASTHTAVAAEADDDGDVEIAIGEDGEPESETETFEMDTEGVLRVSDEKIEIEYFETELTGMDGACTNISFDRENPGLVTMLRTGSIETALVFEEGRRNVCAYTTDAMAFEVTIRTWDLCNEMTENGGKLTLDYSMELHGITADHTKIEIDVTVVK